MYADIHQWYLAVNDAIPTTEKYEDMILKFYQKLYIKPDRQLETPFLTAFYAKEKYSKNIAKIIVSALKWAFTGAIFAFITSYILAFINGTWKENLVTASIAAGAAFILFEGLTILLNFLSYKSIIKKLATMESNLKEVMISLPSGYRNSEKMRYIMQVYYAQKGVVPEVAFDIADEYYNKRHQKKIRGVMFDQPFRNDFIVEEEYIAGQQVVEKTKDEKILDNPNLPSDVKSKTFRGSDDAKKDLDSMIGLASVKDQIEKLENRIKFYGNQNNGNHMQFLGSAGTGKTTVARIVTKILFDLGYINKNHYVEISGDYLKAGSTARADAIMEYSMGGVLFIDEAYLLYDKNGYSSEAIGVLLKAMEDHRKDFVVILAGYEEQMTRLTASNEGFSSRIKHTIYFPDYTDDEMLDIFKFFISNYSGKSYKISDEAVPLLLETFSLEKQAKSFGNARTVRNAVDAIMDNYADRNINSGTDTKIIEVEDVQKYQDSRKIFLQHETKNSSAANNVDESIIRLSELKPKIKNGSENPDEAFSNLIGFDSFKEEVDILKRQKEFENTKGQKILLMGQPGSGFPWLIPIITGYLYELGYIQENKYLSISADFLKGSYVGHTSKRAQAIISYATGGVLFIKHINDLQDDTFSAEARAVILEAINNEDLTIIIADYESELLNSIADQFNVVYQAPKQSAETLTKIFIKQAEDEGFTVSDAAINKIRPMLSNKNIKDTMNLYEKVKKKHIANFTEENKYIIVEDDVEKPKLKLNLNNG